MRVVVRMRFACRILQAWSRRLIGVLSGGVFLLETIELAVKSRRHDVEMLFAFVFLYLLQCRRFLGSFLQGAAEFVLERVDEVHVVDVCEF